MDHGARVRYDAAVKPGGLTASNPKICQCDSPGMAPQPVHMSMQKLAVRPQAFATMLTASYAAGPKMGVQAD